MMDRIVRRSGRCVKRTNAGNDFVPPTAQCLPELETPDALAPENVSKLARTLPAPAERLRFDGRENHRVQVEQAFPNWNRRTGASVARTGGQFQFADVFL